MRNVKWLLSVLLVLAFALAAWGDTGPVETAIKAAESMSLAELEAAAKAELEANPGVTFNADSLTSGVKKALTKFEKKWLKGSWHCFILTVRKYYKNIVLG